MSKLVLTFPNTPAMRALLGQLTGHIHDDYCGQLEDEGDVHLTFGPNVSIEEAETACSEFVDITTLTLFPEIATWPKTIPGQVLDSEKLSVPTLIQPKRTRRRRSK